MNKETSIFFYLSPLPTGNINGGASDVLLQTMLLKTLLKVATKYKTVHYSQTFTSSFLDPLLRISLAPHPGIRLIVQEIFHTLIDRHDNLEKLKRFRHTSDISRLGLVVEKCPRQVHEKCGFSATLAQTHADP